MGVSDSQVTYGAAGVRGPEDAKRRGRETGVLAIRSLGVARGRKCLGLLAGAWIGAIHAQPAAIRPSPSGYLPAGRATLDRAPGLRETRNPAQPTGLLVEKISTAPRRDSTPSDAEQYPQLPHSGVFG